MGAMTETTKKGATITAEPEPAALLTESIPRTLCTPELAERLRQHHARTGAPQSYHVRRAVEEYLDRQERK